MASYKNRENEQRLKQMRLYQEVVWYFGGTELETARALNVTQPTVSGWVCGYNDMSPRIALLTEKLSNGKFTREQLCPDVFA